MIDRAGFVHRFRRNSHLLTEQLADFPRDQGIVDPDRAGLGAATAEAAAIDQFRQPVDHPPVQFQVGAGPFAEQFTRCSEIPPIDASEQFRPVIRPINVLVTAFRIDRTGFIASIALHAVIGRQHSRLQEGPVVLLTEHFFQTLQEIVDDLRLFFRRLGDRQIQRRKSVQRKIIFLFHRRLHIFEHDLFLSRQ